MLPALLFCKGRWTWEKRIGFSSSLQEEKLAVFFPFNFKLKRQRRLVLLSRGRRLIMCNKISFVRCHQPGQENVYNQNPFSTFNVCLACLKGIDPTQCFCYWSLVPLVSIVLKTYWIWFHTNGRNYIRDVFIMLYKKKRQLKFTKSWDYMV